MIIYISPYTRRRNVARVPSSLELTRLNQLNLVRRTQRTKICYLLDVSPLTHGGDGSRARPHINIHKAYKYIYINIYIHSPYVYTSEIYSDGRFAHKLTASSKLDAPITSGFVQGDFLLLLFFVFFFFCSNLSVSYVRFARGVRNGN